MWKMINPRYKYACYGEPYWEDEVLPELGWSLEGQVIGSPAKHEEILRSLVQIRCGVEILKRYINISIL